MAGTGTRGARSGQGQGVLATVKEQATGLIQELERGIADFEANQLPEYREMKELHARLTGTTPAPAAPSAPARGRGRSQSRPAATNVGGSSGRRRGGPTRAEQALKIVTDNPGATIPQIAEQMGLDPNYLYRVMPKLQQDGKVRRDENGSWHPTRIDQLEAAAAS